MAISPRSLVPLAHVADVARSIAFYGRLGLTVRNTFVPPGQTDPSWAWLESGGARLMVARADLPLTPESEGVLFYIYVDDVAAARAALESDSVAVGPIAYPFYAPGGEFRVHDPDDYVLMVTHT
jgi:catechol 2,3-dioxygenase-like lactoylglutathione lyase family enzyme